MSTEELWELGLASIKELEAERGILASARSEAYGCVFGRDSLVTSLFLMKAYGKTNDRYFLNLVRKILINLAQLQGRTVNIESGEEPGKCIHEYRIDQHEHLTQALHEPWYVYEDSSMRNYDSVDATPLFLITLHRYLEAAGEEEQDRHIFLKAAHAALVWLREYGDTNGDGFIDYHFHSDRVHGGLRVQSWMDSSESLFFEHTDARPVYAIAPVEVQAYAYVALKEWGVHFSHTDSAFSQELLDAASSLKVRFNDAFVLRRGGRVTLAHALDGNGRRLTSARSSMAHCLWVVAPSHTVAPDTVLDAAHIPGIVERLLAPDLFVPSAGIRTLSARSRHFNAVSYHNGSIWPHDTAIFAEGLENFGYREEAARVRASLQRAYARFKTPIELFGYSRGFREYREETGRGACRTQAWSAAAMLTTALDVRST